MSEEFPKYFQYKDRTYSVVGYAESVDQYIDNKAYIRKSNNKLYICSKNEPPVHKDVPILKVTITSTEDEDGTVWNEDIEYIDLREPFNMDDFDASNAYQLDYDTILNQTNGDEELYNEEVLTDMNAATSVFRPIINPEDDPLKKLIKQAIIDLEIDINSLKHKLPHKYALTNMKSALIGKTKMSITNFIVWAELLDLDFDFMIYSKELNGSKRQRNVLEKGLHFSSQTGMIDQM